MISFGNPDPSSVPFAPLTQAELNERWRAALMSVGVHAVSGGALPDRDIADYRAYLVAAVGRSAWIGAAA